MKIYIMADGTSILLACGRIGARIHVSYLDEIHGIVGEWSDTYDIKSGRKTSSYRAPQGRK